MSPQIVVRRLLMIYCVVWICSTSLFLKLQMILKYRELCITYFITSLFRVGSARLTFNGEENTLLIRLPLHKILHNSVPKVFQALCVTDTGNLSASRYLFSIFFPFTFTFLHTICFFLLSLLFLTLTHCQKTSTKLLLLERYFIPFCEPYKKFWL